MNHIHAIQKTIPLPAFLLVTALLAGCSKGERAEIADKAKDAYHDTKSAVTRTWENVKSYTFEKRSDFALELKARQAELDAQLSRLRAEYSEEKASASRRAAMEELKNSEADYKAKLSALGTASADTWDAARDNVVAAWDRLQAAYAKARAD
jgi:hypothetical protein